MRQENFRISEVSEPNDNSVYCTQSLKYSFPYTLKLNSIWLITFLLFIFYSESFPQYNAPYFYNSRTLDINKIKMPLNNYGGAFPRSNYATYHDSIGEIVFDHGLFFIGKIQDEIRESHILWESLFSPGPIINNKPAMQIIPSDSLRYSVYKIAKGDTIHIDSLSNFWPYDLGAPLSENKKPKLYADQTLWAVYNAADSNSILPKTSTRRSLYPSFPLEIHHTAYSYESGFDEKFEFLDETIFIEWTIINKGFHSIDSAYLGLWTDIDFCYASHNLPAVDSLNQLGYCWMEQRFGRDCYRDSLNIPAVGYILLYGPLVSDPGSIAIYKGLKRVDYKNLPLSGFWGISDDSYPDNSDYGPAYSRETAWNISRGLDKLGNVIIDPTTQLPTKFKYSGDPITNSGWLANVQQSGGGAGFYMFSGPVTMAPQDTQWVMFALTAAQGGDNMKSITELRRRASILHQFDYNEIVKQSEIEVFDPNPPAPLPSTFALYQNYPNPFNPSTTIRYSIPFTSDVSFKIYNILGSEVWSSFENSKAPGTYELKWNGKNNSGTEIGSGVYVLKVESGSLSRSVKLMMIK